MTVTSRKGQLFPEPIAGASGNTATLSGNLTANVLVVGASNTSIQSLGATGNTITVLHGSANSLPTFSSVVEDDISLSNVTTNDVTSVQHGFAPRLSGNANTFFTGTGTYAQVTEAGLSLSNVTNNDVSASQHGFVPRLVGNANTFFNATGAYSVPTVSVTQVGTDSTTNIATTAFVQGFAPGGSNSLTLQVNAVNNASQAKLNLSNGNAVFVTDAGAGTVTFTNAFTPATITFPPSTGWTWQSQNVGGSINTVSTTNNRIALTTDGSHDGIAAYVRNEISANFTISAIISVVSGYHTTSARYFSAGLAVTDGTKLIVYGLLGFNNTNYLSAFKWSNATTANVAVTGFTEDSGIGNILTGAFGAYMWLRIQETASNRIYSISPDGVIWNQISSTTNTDFLTTSKYGLFIRGSSASGINTSAAMACISFAETTP